MIDLHVHSSKSDGSLSPAGLVELAVQKGLSAFALTDHDTVEGLDEALASAAAYNASLARPASSRSGASGKPKETVGRFPLEVIPGIEFSTECQGRDIHILGYLIDYASPRFLKSLKAFVDSRNVRNEKMCHSLSSEGFDITYEKLLKEFPGAVITRCHYARYLLDRGYVKTLNEAFERYIGDGCRHFIPRKKITPAQAVGLIKETSGIAVLAHPALYRMSDAALRELVRKLKEAGLDGIEAIYPTYSPGEERKLRSLAFQEGLLITGGSDYHGSAKPGLELGTGYGKLCVGDELLARMKRKLSALSLGKE